MRNSFIALVAVLSQLSVLSLHAQDSIPRKVTLGEAVEYSVKNQPLIRQSEIDERITEENIRSRLADWYPQVNFGYNLQHNFIVQTNIIGGNPVRLGVENISAFQFNASQTIFNRDVLLASRTRRDVRRQASQNTTSSKIDITVAVSKAFYDVLASRQQVKVSNENIIRVERSLRDARNQYEAGVTDKTDYKRATIALNNARAALKSNQEFLKAKLEYLKAVMGYPEEKQLDIVYDSLQMEKEAIIDTLQPLDYTKRIEFRLLETQRSLLEANLKYNKWSFLPTLIATGAYNFNYLSNEFSKLYNINYPNSFAALTVAFPIFQGGRRVADINAARWQLQRNNFAIVNLKNTVSSEFENAMASYKANLATYFSLRENLDLAQEVYDIIQLQYRSGIKTYLEVINSETDLRTAQINYYNALYNLMASKIDVQRTSGEINY